MKIIKIKEDITSEIANSFKNSIAIDTEATGLQIPERDKLSLIQLGGQIKLECYSRQKAFLEK